MVVNSIPNPDIKYSNSNQNKRYNITRGPSSSRLTLLSILFKVK